MRASLFRAERPATFALLAGFDGSMNSLLCTLALALLGLAASPFSARGQGTETPPGFQRWELNVDGAARTALLFAPPSAKTSPTPVVFVFHGHGGTAQAAARSFGIHREWPEAISVYMQGLNTPGRLTDPEGKKPGWQQSRGQQGDRDLKFFDAVLARLKAEHKVDERRIYATGHSNGGSFTYLLWAVRGDTFAAVAPSGSAAAQNLPLLKPKPALHLAGEKDPLVKYEWQRATMDALRKLNGCAPQNQPWSEHCTLYPSAGGTPLVEFIHPGGHEFPAGAGAAFVKFFKEHPAAEK